jgi:hypothetical protein
MTNTHSLPFADDNDREVLLTAKQAESIIEEINHFAGVLVQTANHLRNCIKRLDVGRGYEALGYKDMSALFKSDLLEKSRSTLQKEWQAHRVEQALELPTGSLVLEHGLKLFPVFKKAPEKLEEVYHAAIEEAEISESSLNARCIQNAISQVTPELKPKPKKRKPKKQKPTDKSKVVQDGGSSRFDVVHNNPVAQQSENEIKVFSGSSNAPTTNTIDADLSWIKTIASLGDRSIEFEEEKSNYQAGTDFENISRKSLEFLGFKVEEYYKGGTGGLDLYCSQPYPLVCECKAGKSIPDRAVEELDRIGKRHLEENYLQALRLIIGPGEPTKQLKASLIKSAKISKTSVIKAMTLQKLVELKAKYPGAINLIELKEYLEPGQIDDKINEYIEKVEQEIKLRSHIIQVLKNYLQLSQNESAKVESLHAIYVTSNPPQNLDDRELYNILIELSSPLTGYLGRMKEDDWKKDRFYYLRDLAIN